MATETLYKVLFYNEQKVFEVYVKDVFFFFLYGIVVLEGFIFGERNTVVVDPAEEKLKTAFEGVTSTVVPMHSIIRIDVVEKQGVSKIKEAGSGSGNVAQFPSPIYTPSKPE